MTHPTKAIFRWMLSDFVRVSNVSHQNQQPADSMLYTEDDLEASYKRIIAVDFDQVVDVGGGLKVTAICAGHVLGAAQFVVEFGEHVRLVYTGDYSREEDRHLPAAQLPPQPVDVLIVESTYGVQSHQPRAIREARFVQGVQAIVTRGGRCLIPVFALGRAQELLLILDEHWEAKRKTLGMIPVYYASALAKKCMAIYQTYVHMMNASIRARILPSSSSSSGNKAGSNPFHFKHITALKSPKEFADDGKACVMMASPAMLQNGFSRQLFESWCGDGRSGMIIPGYVVEGTLGKAVLAEPKEIPALNSGQMLPLKMSVDYVSFSAHVDYGQNVEFIGSLKPSHTILVHGEASEAGRLRTALQHKFTHPSTAVAPGSTAKEMRFYTPRNGESLQLVFAGAKWVKVMGSLAKQALQKSKRLAEHPPPSKDGDDGDGDDGRPVWLGEGVLVVKDFQYHMVAPQDLLTYGLLGDDEDALRPIVMRESLTLPSRAMPSLVESCLLDLLGAKCIARINPHSWILFDTDVAKMDAEVGEDQEDALLKDAPNRMLLKQVSDTHYQLQWTGNSVNDMLADTVMAVVFAAEGSRLAVKTQSRHSSHHGHVHPHSEHGGQLEAKDPMAYVDLIQRVLADRFSQVEELGNAYRVKVQEGLPPILVSLEDLSVSLEKDETRMEEQEDTSSQTSSAEEELSEQDALKMVKEVVEGACSMLAPHFALPYSSCQSLAE